MKKLILAVVAVAMATVVQAAAVQWQSSGATSADLGRPMYLLTSISSTYESLTAFEAAAVDRANVIKVMQSYKINQHEAKHDTITTSANFYLAVVDNNTIHYLDVTDSFRGKVYSPPDSSSGTTTTAFADVANSTTTATIGGDPGPAPEPTSGLLLIFGVAGLALRRRRV